MMWQCCEVAVDWLRWCKAQAMSCCAVFVYLLAILLTVSQPAVGLHLVGGMGGLLDLLWIDPSPRQC